MPISTPMQLHLIPNFCGGRLLTNFFGYEPHEFDLFFKQVIGQLGTVENHGNLGMVAAYTNRAQKNAEPFLEKLGFKRIFTTDKYGNYDRNTGKSIKGMYVDNTSPCVSWAGDWYYDVLPAIKAYQAELVQKRAEEVKTSNLRRPAAPVAPATPPPQVTNIGGFSVGEVVRRVFSNHAFTIVAVHVDSESYSCSSHVTGNITRFHRNDIVSV